MKTYLHTYLLIQLILLMNISITNGQLHQNKRTECDSLFDSKKYLHAIECYNTQTKERLIDSNTYFNEGLSFVNLRKYQESIEFFNKAIQFNPKDYMAYFCKGYALFELKKYELAIKNFDSSLTINSKYGIAYSYRAMAQYKMDNDIIEALKKCEYALKLEVDSIEKSLCYFNLGSLKFIKSDYQPAIEYFHKAIVFSNDFYTGAYLQKASCEVSLNKFQDALNDYTEIINHFPDLYFAYIERANVRLKLDDKKGACEDFHQALELGCDENYLGIRKTVRK
jgi:tetratricopeptide (TPR) repeat protein